MKQGAPDKYKPEYDERVIDFMSKGYSKEAFAGEIGVSKKTLYNWMKRHKSFLHAIKKAEVKCQKFWEELGIELVLAGQGNATAWIFNMKNRFAKNGWNDMKIIDKTIRKPQPLLDNVHRHNRSQEATPAQKEN